MWETHFLYKKLAPREKQRKTTLWLIGKWYQKTLQLLVILKPVALVQELSIASASKEFQTPQNYKSL